jgi:hypothetical protein
MTKKPASDDPDRLELERLERLAAEGQEVFDRALLRIHDEGLYRASHPTWDDYLSERWSMTRQTAARRFDWLSIVDSLSPMGYTDIPERHARELARLRRGAGEKGEELVREVAKKLYGSPKANRRAAVTGVQFEREVDRALGKESDEKPSYRPPDYRLRWLDAVETLRKIKSGMTQAESGWVLTDEAARLLANLLRRAMA